MLDDDACHGRSGHGGVDQALRSPDLSGADGMPILDDEKLNLLKAYFPPQKFRDYVSACCGQIGHHVAMLIHAMRIQDEPGIIWHAHDMKSLCGNIGAACLAEMARRIEAEAKAQNVPRLQGFIKDLQDIEELTSRALREKLCLE